MGCGSGGCVGEARLLGGESGGGRDPSPAGSGFGGYQREGVGFLESGTGLEDLPGPPSPGFLRDFREF